MRWSHKWSLYCCVGFACASRLTLAQPGSNLSSNTGLPDLNTSTGSPSYVHKLISAWFRCAVLVTSRYTWHYKWCCTCSHGGAASAGRISDCREAGLALVHPTAASSDHRSGIQDKSHCSLAGTDLNGGNTSSMISLTRREHFTIATQL